MADTKITIRITEHRGSVGISYTAVGQVAGLLTSNVRGEILRSPVPPKTGSRAWWESILQTVNADITAGNGGGT